MLGQLTLQCEEVPSLCGKCPPQGAATLDRHAPRSVLKPAGKYKEMTMPRNDFQANLSSAKSRNHGTSLHFKI